MSAGADDVVRTSLSLPGVQDGRTSDEWDRTRRTFRRTAVDVGSARGSAGVVLAAAARRSPWSATSSLRHRARSLQRERVRVTFDHEWYQHAHSPRVHTRRRVCTPLTSVAMVTLRKYGTCLCTCIPTATVRNEIQPFFIADSLVPTQALMRIFTLIH